MTSDTLIPEYDSSRRKSSGLAATFNLTATILGGGVLSLPLAFEKCGMILATLLMVVSLVITERSLFLLCLCARISGATTYGEVGKAAFGTRGEYGISIILFIYLMFVLVAFMILVQDIWCSIVQIVANKHEGELNNDFVLLVVLILMSPFFVQRTLHALRFNCYIGFASVPILLLALIHHSLTTPITLPPLMWTTSFSDVLFAFPMINLAFLCVFNVLPVQAALIEPTRQRMLSVIDGALGSAFVIMVPFGVYGCLYAGHNADGNILNNIEGRSDWESGGIGEWLFFLGRLGCGITLTLAMPLMVLPCRESLLEIVDVAINGPHVVVPHEEIPLIMDPQKAASNQFEIVESVSPKRRKLDEGHWTRYLSTFGILNVCYMVSIHVPGVAVVWSLVGSSMAFLIAFILPSICYIKIEANNRFPSNERKSWLWFAWWLLIMAVMAAVACTTQSVSRLL